VEILVAGATGYIGRRLVPQLLASGHRVRALVRDPARAAAQLPAGCTLWRGDVLDPPSLGPALTGVEVAYYLVHSMGSGEFDFEARDRRAAANFGAVARAHGVQRIIYLGGLGREDGALSSHLRSRQEVGAVLARQSVATTELRAAIVVGAGSASFQMVRDLVEHLPVMVCPRWVTTRCQPIAVDDVVAYLVRCLDTPATVGRVLEVGGPQVLTYAAMLREVAALLGRRLWLVPVPVLTPRLSSYWIDLVTSVPTDVARPLIEGLRSEVVVREPSATVLLPIERTPFTTAVRRALADEPTRPHEPARQWCRRLPGRLGRLLRDWLAPAVLQDERTRLTTAPAPRLFATVAALGGEDGWYAYNWAWHVRGWVDRMLGGPGLAAATPRDLSPGGRLGFWRVQEVEPPRRLWLKALMKLPGHAELEFAVAPQPMGSRLVQTARFAPRGLVGYLYWYLLLPMHALIFDGLATAIVRRADRAALGRPSLTATSQRPNPGPP
jgi:uncharacterized protein YbjT (DUF2867 family)